MVVRKLLLVVRILLLRLNLIIVIEWDRVFSLFCILCFWWMMVSMLLVYLIILSS